MHQSFFVKLIETLFSLRQKITLYESYGKMWSLFNSFMLQLTKNKQTHEVNGEVNGKTDNKVTK